MNLKATIIVILFVLAGCAPEKNSPKKNLAQARRIFEQIQIGAGHEQGCRSLEVECVPQKADFLYVRDIGISYSTKEVIIRMFIRKQKVVRVEILRPHYEGRTRKLEVSEILNEKGLSRDKV